jgi:hypothetical protein
VSLLRAVEFRAYANYKDSQTLKGPSIFLSLKGRFLRRVEPGAAMISLLKAGSLSIETGALILYKGVVKGNENGNEKAKT